MCIKGSNHNKAHPYTKWLLGWIDGGGWTGAHTLRDANARAQKLKQPGVSWYMLGKLMATEQAFGRSTEANDWQEVIA